MNFLKNITKDLPENGRGFKNGDKNEFVRKIFQQLPDQGWWISSKYFFPQKFGFLKNFLTPFLTRIVDF